MRNLHRLRHRIKLQHLHTLPLTKAVVTTAIILCTVTLITLRLCQWQSAAKLAALQEQAAQLEKENAALSSQIENIDRLDAIRKIANKELNLVDPGTIIIGKSE